MNKETLKKYFVSIEAERIDDGIIDVAIDFDLELFKEMGYEIKYKNEYVSVRNPRNNEEALFYVTEYENKKVIWFWALTPTRYNLTRKAKRLSKFELYDEETTQTIKVFDPELDWYIHNVYKREIEKAYVEEWNK